MRIASDLGSKSNELSSARSVGRKSFSPLSCNRVPEIPNLPSTATEAEERKTHVCAYVSQHFGFFSEKDPHPSSLSVCISFGLNPPSFPYSKESKELPPPPLLVLPLPHPSCVLCCSSGVVTHRRGAKGDS